MICRATAVVALAGTAVAFSPMMSIETSRRQVVQVGAAAAVAVPLLRANPAEAVMNDGTVGARNKRGSGKLDTLPY